MTEKLTLFAISKIVEQSMKIMSMNIGNLFDYASDFLKIILWEIGFESYLVRLQNFINDFPVPGTYGLHF